MTVGKKLEWTIFRYYTFIRALERIILRKGKVFSICASNPVTMALVKS